MIIKDVYSHNDGEKYINDNHKSEYDEIVSRPLEKIYNFLYVIR